MLIKRTITNLLIKTGLPVDFENQGKIKLQ